MKTRILTFALLFAPLFMFAQIGIGVKAGANFCDINTDQYSTNSATNFHAGAYANLKLSDNFGITPEVLWSTHGADLDDVEFKTNNITVPVMLRWRIFKPLSLEAGPQWTLLTKAKSGGKDVTDDLNSSTFGVAFGALVHLPLGFNVGARYVIGMSDLSTTGNQELKDRVFQLYAGWTIFGAK